MWKTQIEKLTSECKFCPGATTELLSEAEQRLGVFLPEELKSLLSESNGIRERYNLDLIWPIERIVKENIEIRREPAYKDLYMPFESLLFFTDAGNGDQFAFPILNGETRRSNIFVWNHEDDSRTWVAPSLRIFIEWFYAGKIKS